MSVAVAGLARSRGFRKKGLTFRRKHGQTPQVINFQLSRGNTAAEGDFYVNIGISFDAVTALGGSTTGLLMIAGEAVHFGVRLEELAPGAPAQWDVTQQTDAQALGERLGATLAPVIDRLEPIESPASMLREFSLDEGTQRILRAELEYVGGNFNAALAELKLVAAEFADRRGMSVESLIERYCLHELKPLLS
ncbi:DUF4304 domain-containing protein [Archangium lansingense]|uniref:DUF4304 domain-containing protein n=1 Tax=Archangium lansingense TaxID=2995310 RepID=A0ABT4AIN7_9BACT|nr:DUF4304 domain-containing protein [Archangium lansinium]MCY1081556.1 DUF4304 domain-containing protein [Archangium lansinium]